jgi:hypothetical protein
LFRAVPHNARLEDLQPGSSLHSATTRLYDAFRMHNIGPAKRSKLLHIKRSWLIPICDSVVRDVYGAAGRSSGDYWEAVRRDLIDGGAVLQRAASMLTATVEERRLARLTSLRLLDIVAWQLSGTSVTVVGAQAGHTSP